MEMKQDSLLVKGDLSKAHQTMSRPDVNDDLNEKNPIGEAQAAPKKKREKRTKEKSIPPPAPSANGATPNQENTRTGYRNRRFGCGSEFHLLPQCSGKQPHVARRASIAMDRMFLGVSSIQRPLAWDCFLTALRATAPSSLIREHQPSWLV